jgi:hypothetical protein
MRRTLDRTRIRQLFRIFHACAATKPACFCTHWQPRIRPLPPLRFQSSKTRLTECPLYWGNINLLRLFDWSSSSAEARAAWQGFLWSPRLVRPFLVAVKPALLETAHHYAELGDHASQYAAFLTSAALDPGDTFSVEELRETFRQLPPEALTQAASALVRRMENGGEQHESFWSNRVAPFLKQVWPKSAYVSPSIADELFELCIVTGPNFSAALSAVRPWLVSVTHPRRLVRLLDQSGLCELFPSDALEWLNLLIDVQPMPPNELSSCLEAISRSTPALLKDPRYLRLNEYCRQHGM